LKGCNRSVENECGIGGTFSTEGFDLIGENEGSFSNDLEARREIADGLLTLVGSASGFFWGKRTLRGLLPALPNTDPFFVNVGT
jgi:hypothetical protein